MTDPVIFALNQSNREHDRSGVYGDFAVNENQSADSAPGLVSWGFIRAAIRRSARFWGITALLGLLIGLGVYHERPHEPKAAASVMLTLSPYENSLTAIEDNQALAQTAPVAAIAVRELRLQQSAASFLNTYSALSVTDRVLTITATGSSASQASLRANAVGNAFLKFRADELRAQQKLVLESLDQQIKQASQRVNSIGAQISQLPSHPASATQRSQLAKLQAEQTSATATLGSLQQAVTGNQTTTLPALTAALKNSRILSVNPVPYSRKKELAIYGGLGLIVGLALGMGIVIVRALASDRLRRRDDVAYALDAPVKLSVGPLRVRRRLPALPGRAARQELDMRRVIAHLHQAVRRSTQAPAGLVIVAVDNAPIVARCVAALATSYAGQGNRVITADLSAGAHLAQLLRDKNPGVHAVSHDGVNFMIAVPDRDDLAPVGPLPLVTSPATPAQGADALVAPDTAADVLLTLATLHPALGGAHLETWAANAVVVVSAGQSSAEKIHAVGDMIRLAGMRLDSVVLIGADKSDESLGLMGRQDEEVGVGVLNP